MLDIEVRSSLNGHGVANYSGLPDTVIGEDASLREIATKLSRWVDNARHASGRSSMFDRGAYTPPDNVYEEMRAEQTALSTTTSWAASPRSPSPSPSRA